MNGTPCALIHRMKPTFAASLSSYINALNAQAVANGTHVHFAAEETYSYFRIVRVDGGGNRSAVAFAHKATGDMYRPASFTKPAKNKCGNLFEISPRETASRAK